MAEALLKLEQEACRNANMRQDLNKIGQFAEKYFDQNRDRLDKAVDNIENLLVGTLPIDADGVDYEFPRERLRRITDEMSEILARGGNQNWSISSASISDDLDQPSVLKVNLKDSLLLIVTIDSQYPLTPPEVLLEGKEVPKAHPCIDENRVNLFEKIWSPALTLEDVIRFSSTIAQGDDPTNTLTTYVTMHQDNRLNEMLKNGDMKGYLLKYTNPVCKCGAEMEQKNTSECYVNQYSYVICDGCDVICKPQYGVGKEIVYHCPKEKVTDVHPHGYDICFECVYRNHLRYRQFNALIISPPVSKYAKSRDCEQLEIMFKELGYHRVIALKDDKTTKQNIKTAIHSLYHDEQSTNVNKVNVIVYTGHGNNYHDQFYFDIAGGSLSEKELKSFIYSKDENEKDVVDEDVIDGYGKVKQVIAAIGGDRKAYLRQNTLILINACHSGTFTSLNQKQNRKDQGNKQKLLEMVMTDVSDQIGFDLSQLDLRGINKSMMKSSNLRNKKKSNENIPSNPYEWSKEEVSQWVKHIGYPQYMDDFVQQQIDGEALFELPNCSKQDFGQLHIYSQHHIESIIYQIHLLRKSKEKEQVVDNVDADDLKMGWVDVGAEENPKESDGSDVEDDDDQKVDSFFKLMDEGMGDVMNEISCNTHSALVISSCMKHERSLYLGDTSPFIGYVLEFFKRCKQNISKDAKKSITSSLQPLDSPLKLYEFIQKKGREPHPETGIELSVFEQNVNVASKRGCDQFALFPLF